ncbi:TonB-dependent receptor domain-containing protein [Flagellimonas myxillae]|uniref:TonB-dependent receptor domain-containing protein n=1 Tax=Flagellimonas myxillae TaxID=2942214 RepID=UPI00201F5A81|nr:TonB-dependent receptor [Muricauda myxillae]MCL6265908.1 TonB-dependent receptor [Muricauda myxillae]
MRNPFKGLMGMAPLMLFCLLAQMVHGQNTINGSVQDDSGNPLAFANVLLLKASDSSLTKGTITMEDGKFLLENIPSGNYVLTASMIGFGSQTTEIFKFDGGSKNLPLLTLSEGLALDEVVVSGRKNLYVQKIDRMVINVASSIISTGSSALEVLERSPGVIIDRQNNGISLVGKGGVVVMINGKQTYMPTSSLVQMLQGMSSDNIETIELITTPPANFDAEGNAGFINIVLKQRTDLGLNGSYSLSLGVGKGSTTSDNINFNYRKNNINIFGDYSFLRNGQKQIFDLDRNFVDMNNIPVNIATISDRDPVQRNHGIRTGLDFQASDKTILGLLLWGNDNKWTMDARNESVETVNGTRDAFVELLTTERNQLENFGANVNLRHDFKEGGFFGFDLDYLKYNIENPTNYSNSFFDGNNNLLREELTSSDKTTPINITVGKVDYSNQISDKVKLETGVKAAFSDFDNDVDVGTFEDGNFMEDDDLTNLSNLKERILATYGSLNYSISDKTSLQLGLRYEHTDSKLVSDKQGVVVDRSFGELFPTAFISHKINDTLSYNFSYSRRITRPTFNDMAPFVIFLDPTTFFAGNPAVQPAISNAVKFDFNYRSCILSAQYSIENGTISKFQSRFDEENERLVFGAENLDRTKIFSLTLGLPINFTHWWKMQNNLTYLNTQIENTFSDEPLTFEQNTFNLNSTQSFTLNENLSAEINLSYNSPTISSLLGTGVLAEIVSLNLGVQQKLGDKWGTLSLKLNDALDTMKWTITRNIPEENLTTHNTFDLFNRTFLISYSNSFGNSKLKSARQRGTGAEEEKQRVN